jgi:hypothetical protein
VPFLIDRLRATPFVGVVGALEGDAPGGSVDALRPLGAPGNGFFAAADIIKSLESRICSDRSR